MALAQAGLLSRQLATQVCVHKHLARWKRTSYTCPNFCKFGVRLRYSATNQDLAALGLPAEDLVRVEDLIAKTEATGISDSIKVLIDYAGSATAASKLVRQHPKLLCCQLPSWIEFLTAFGLNKAQVQHVLCQTPEALIEGDLVRAGQSLLAFRRIGLDDYAATQLVTYYPQLLGKNEAEIRALLSLLGRYQTGIETHTDVRRG